MQITDWAKTVGTLARCAQDHATQSATSAPATPPKAVSQLGDAPPATGRPARASARVRRRDYPRFYRRGEHLVKVGWSKTEHAEYEHKAPRRVIDALAAAIARRSTNGKVFTAEDLFPLSDPQDASEIPAYQAYVALAWLKSAALVKQHGRSGYSARKAEQLNGAVTAAWVRLAEYTA